MPGSGEEERAEFEQLSLVRPKRLGGEAEGKLASDARASTQLWLQRRIARYDGYGK